MDVVLIYHQILTNSIASSVWKQLGGINVLNVVITTKDEVAAFFAAKQIMSDVSNLCKFTCNYFSVRGNQMQVEMIKSKWKYRLL